MKNSSKPKILLFDSYIQAVKNSVGSNLFRNFYAKINGRKEDIRKDGQLSCSAFVSSILYLHKLCYDVHATVEGLIKDMELFGWEKITKPRVGAVLIWEAKKFKGGGMHKHIGFYIGKNKAISSRPEKRQPAEHHWTFGTKGGKPIRKIINIFWNNKLQTR